jgi:iron(III) transport system substrate-binding protein
MKKQLAAIALAASSVVAMAQGQVNIICSVQAEWCNMIGTVYGKTTGAKVNI